MGREWDEEYTESEEDILVTLNVIGSTFSFLGASFIFLNYWFFPDLRSFAFKLVRFLFLLFLRSFCPFFCTKVLMVAIGDMINSVGNFMGSPEKDSAACAIQGFIVQFGDLTSFGWCTAIAWTIYTVLTSENAITKADARNWFRRMHLVIWVSPTLFFFRMFCTLFLRIVWNSHTFFNSHNGVWRFPFLRGEM